MASIRYPEQREHEKKWLTSAGLNRAMVESGTAAKDIETRASPYRNSEIKSSFDILVKYSETGLAKRQRTSFLGGDCSRSSRVLKHINIIRSCQEIY